MNNPPLEKGTTHKLRWVCRNYKTGIFVALALLLWPILIVFPWGTDASLDGSWPEVLLYAHLKGWQFGRDVIFTWGPWGFLNNQFHLGAAGATTKIIWETVGKLGIAAALVALTRKIPLLWQIAFVFSCIFFSWVFLDTIFLVLITLIVTAGLLDEKTPRWQQWLWVFSLAFLGQIKFTYTLFACAGIVFSASFRCLRKEYATAATQGGVFVAAFLLFWVGAGQNPANIPAFLRTGLEISTGYGWAMGLDERRAVFQSCLILAFVCVTFVFYLWRTLPDRALAWTAAPFLGCTWFVVWKHGLVRADGHEVGFVVYSMLLALVLPSLLVQRPKWHWFNFAAALGVACFNIIQPGMPVDCLKNAPARFLRNYRVIGELGSLPQKWQGEFDRAASQADLPKVRQTVGDQSLDLFNFDQGVALLNKFNYTPRPIFQSYSAYTPDLMSRNLRFYQSKRAPDYILWNQSSIDSRYPTIDDALLVAELPRAYQPVLEEGNFILLKKQSQLPAQPLDRRLILKQSLRLGEVFVVPQGNASAIWLQAKVKLNKLGKLRAFFYKPPLIRLTVTDDTGRETSWRLLPQASQEGFLLSPLVETQSDFLAFCQGHTLHQIRSLKFEAPRKQKEFWPHDGACAEIKLFALPQITSEPAAATAQPPIPANTN